MISLLQLMSTVKTYSLRLAYIEFPVSYSVGLKSFSLCYDLSVTYFTYFSRLERGPSNNALLSLELEYHLHVCDLGLLNKFIDFYLVIQ